MVKAYRHHVLVCTASGTGAERDSPGDADRCRFCSDKGGEAVREAFRAAVDEAGMDDVKITRMGCTVQHAHGPVVIVYPEGTWYGGVQPADAGEIVSRHLVGGGEPVARLVIHQMDTPGGEPQ